MTIQNHVFLINTNYSDKYFARVEISARMKLKRYTSNVYKFDGGVIVVYKFDDAEHVNKRDECWFLYILSVALFYLLEKLNRQRYLLMIQVHLMKGYVIHFYTGHATSTGNINFSESFLDFVLQWYLSYSLHFDAGMYVGINSRFSAKMYITQISIFLCSPPKLYLEVHICS